MRKTLTDATPPEGRPSAVRPPLAPSIHPLPATVKAMGSLFLAGVAGGLTGDAWLTLFVLAGYPAIWAVCDTTYPTHHKRNR